jgi:phosphate transport system substrate-binding protein
MKRISSKPGASVVIVMSTALVLLIAAAPAFGATTITGTGATFPQLLYQQWASDYHAGNSSVQINYTGTGSGAGQNAIKQGTVDFGASDQPLFITDLNSSGLVQFPTVVGGIVPVYNLAGIGAGKLKLTGDVLAKIYLGQITTWNNAAIKKLNPTIARKLPNATISVVYRSDSSGTTWNFTTYLSRVNATWRTTKGASKSPSWPTGTGAKGSDGVAALVKSSRNTLGYLEYSYATTGHIAYAQMQNSKKMWVLPSAASFSAAAAGARWTWSNGIYTVLANAPGVKSWPMAAATFVLVRTSQKSLDTGKAMLKFFDWAYKSAKGKSDAAFYQFVPMPTSVVAKVEAVWHTVAASGTPCWP